MKILNIIRQILLAAIILMAGGQQPDFNLFGTIPITGSSGGGFFIIAALFSLKDWSNQIIDFIFKAYAVLFVFTILMTSAPYYMFFFAPIALVLMLAGIPIKRRTMKLEGLAQSTEESSEKERPSIIQ